MIENALIKNPKRSLSSSGQDRWYPYYAGYSSEFVSGILNSISANKKATVLDPWNGSGTTTTAANFCGNRVIGYDLNPVMVISAKAGLLNRNDFSSLEPIGAQILYCAENYKLEITENDPLCTWLSSHSAASFRKIEHSLQKILVDSKHISTKADEKFVQQISSIASFFYIALFRTVNHFLKPFRPTNPTWIKVPKSKDQLITPTFEIISNSFSEQILAMLSAVKSSSISAASHPDSRILLASSCSMPAENHSIDLIISSPPYCTRIDYAIATMPELTLLGYHPQSSLDTLRRGLIGTSTISKEHLAADDVWGPTCVSFLNKIYNHPSKASKSYYYKSHLQYFNSIHQSIIEIDRVLKTDGSCILVVQDSHYKEIYNNLPVIFKEMAELAGLTLVKQEHFPSSRNMAKRNPEVKKYRTQATATESVLCFRK